jgi:hypothetical protein
LDLKFPVLRVFGLDVKALAPAKADAMTVVRMTLKERSVQQVQRS